MQQVRAVRPHQVVAPPPGPTAVELSRDEREQLRVVRHHAFERHQRNAAWMRELFQFEHLSTTSDAVVETSDDDQHQHQTSEIDTLNKKLVDQQQQLTKEHEHHADLLRAMRVIESEEALAACRARVLDETVRHANATRKESKVIRL